MDRRLDWLTQHVTHLGKTVASRSGVQNKLRRVAGEYWRRHDDALATASQGTQILLTMAYQERAERGASLPSFDDVEFRMYSQNGEDGILLYLFSLLGPGTKTAVEIGAGNGIECNAANLIINRGWRGLLFDGDENNVSVGKEFYESGPNTSWNPPTVTQAWITRDNVNGLITGYGFADEVDLFSLDLDGIDYWIWDALNCVQPRVVVTEYNWTWGPNEARTVPYAANFSLPPLEGRSHADNIYFGASLSALVKLGRSKGYRLVGCNRWGFNTLFVRTEGEQGFPEVSPDFALTHRSCGAAGARVSLTSTALVSGSLSDERDGRRRFRARGGPDCANGGALTGQHDLSEADRQAVGEWLVDHASQPAVRDLLIKIVRTQITDTSEFRVKVAEAIREKFRSGSTR